jgi:EmrB/QacA subfamily drug resistance transporter
MTSSPSPPNTVHERRWWTLAVLCLSLLMAVLDTTIVNVALPTLDQALGASASGLEWIVDSYTLAFAGLLLLGGALGDRYGRHRALRAGLLTFAAGSLAAALSSDAGELIAARALMGAGAALLMPATLSILSSVFPDPRERAKAIGFWSAVSGLGVALGPTLGGLLLEHFGWSSIFLINVPLVAFAIAAGRRLVPASSGARQRRLDLMGAGLSVAGLSALTYTLIEAPSRGWVSTGTLGMGALAAALLAAFAYSQTRIAEPMVDLSVFSNRRFSGASLAITVLFFALTAATFLLTQIYQLVLGYSPISAGLRSLPSAAMIMIAAPLAAKLAAKTGPRLPIVAGLLLATTGLGIFATASATSGYSHYLLAMAMLCAGIGLTMSPATDSIMASLPRAKAGVGSAINDTTRNIGSVLGIAVIGSIVTTAYRTGLGTSGLAGHMQQAAGQSVGAAVEIAHRLPGAAGHDLSLIAHHAFVHAADRGLLVAAAITLAGAIVALRTLPAASPVAPVVAEHAAHARA